MKKTTTITQNVGIGLTIGAALCQDLVASPLIQALEKAQQYASHATLVAILFWGLYYLTIRFKPSKRATIKPVKETKARRQK